MNSICAIIVTFNPAPTLTENVNIILSQCSQVIIVDNASATKSFEMLNSISNQKGVHLISLPNNTGIGHALNCGVNYALEREFNWIATFDQDSKPAKNFFSTMLNQWDLSDHKLKIKLLSPIYEDPFTRQKHPGSQNADHFLETTMASGNLVSGDVFNEIGLYNADFFMDYIDHDFCLRLNNSGYKILECQQAILFHKLGNLRKHNALFGNFSSTHHNFKRRYYITRNRIILYKKYIFSNPKWVSKDFLSALKETIKIILFEKDKMKKMKAILYGILDGILSNLKNNRNFFAID